MRKLVIEQTEWGQFRIQNAAGDVAVAANIESAIVKFFANTPAGEPPNVTVLHAAEVIDNLLGPDVQVGGQIHTGTVSG